MNLRVLGALSAFVAVATGAFGAHALKGRLPAEALAVFETAARYLLIHAIAIVFVGDAERREPGRGWLPAGMAFSLGVCVFSGSLFALALSGVKLWGAVTPFGGLGLLTGWLACARAAWGNAPSKDPTEHLPR